jgi:hypothetical protein
MPTKMPKPCWNRFERGKGQICIRTTVSDGLLRIVEVLANKDPFVIHSLSFYDGRKHDLLENDDDFETKDNSRKDDF